MSRSGWNITILTGGTAEVPIGTSGKPTFIDRIRVGGTANLAGACLIENGASEAIETIPSGATPGTERVFNGARFPLGCRVTPGNSGDTLIVFWKEEQ